MATQIVDIAALEDYLLDDEDSYDSEDDSSYYSSDEESVDGVSDPILDTFQEKLIVNDLKQKARSRRLKRRAAKKEVRTMKKAQHCEEEIDTTEEASDSEDSHGAEMPDDDSIHAHMKRSGSGMSLASLVDNLEIEDEEDFDDFDDFEEEEEEVELELEVELPLDLTEDALATEIKA